MCIVALIQTRNNSGLKHLEHGLFSEGEAQDKSDSLKKTYFVYCPGAFFLNFFFFRWACSSFPIRNCSLCIVPLCCFTFLYHTN